MDANGGTLLNLTAKLTSQVRHHSGAHQEMLALRVVVAKHAKSGFPEVVCFFVLKFMSSLCNGVTRAVTSVTGSKIVESFWLMVDGGGGPGS
jgi:hypothetical protein